MYNPHMDKRIGEYVLIIFGDLEKTKKTLNKSTSLSFPQNIQSSKRKILNMKRGQCKHLTSVK